MRQALIAIVLFVLGAAGFGAAAVYSGVYDISATDQHTAPVYWLMETAMRRSVKARAKAIAVPPLTDRALIARGFRRYREHCVQCHGAPGVAPIDAAKGMTPVPASLMETGRHWPSAEIYWVVKHGIKMTGMPAWEYRLSDDDLWATVAFVKELPRLSPLQYRRLEAPAAATGLGRDKGAP